MSAGRICNREVIVARVTDSLQLAAELMQRHRVGSVVVCEECGGARIPVGVVTDRDIVLAVLRGGADLKTLPIGPSMSKGVHTLREQDDVSDAIEFMRAHAVRRAPVVDAQGVLVGIVSIDDLLAVLTEQLTSIARLIARQSGEESTWRAHRPA